MYFVVSIRFELSVVDRINSCFGLKLIIHDSRPFCGVVGTCFPYDVTRRPDFRQDRPWAETRR